MADSEANPRVQKWYQRLSEWGNSFAYSKKISQQFHFRRNWTGLGGLSTHMPYRSSPRSKTVLVYSHDHTALQVIRDFLEPLGFTVEVAAAPEVNSVADPS